MMPTEILSSPSGEPVEITQISVLIVAPQLQAPLNENVEVESHAPVNVDIPGAQEYGITSLHFYLLKSKLVQALYY
jgi:hypothetical protein